MADKYEELRRLTERVLGMAVRTPRDYEVLSARIFEKTRQRLSVSTLKRFWGYVDKDYDGSKARLSTLDILAEYVGFQDWPSFCKTEIDAEEDSGTIVNRFLFVRDLEVGTHIQLAWVPDRQLTIRYEGEELFTVVESVRGKLRPGDTFHCSQIVEGMPLMLLKVVRDGQYVSNYICGKTQGVSFIVKD